MSDEQLPEQFRNYWKISSKLPVSEPSSIDKDQLSKEWISFLAAIGKQVKKDLHEEK
ncbi:hypothetical protein H1D32_08945 [Anaerobacillus sp. CMMVII]|uniref:hypothetical protein n=1 Tax=Anaerobacillus sp. CMMVII TaxID=2755588 RepID=UPI0021B79A5C|nr:hypothetical protein [Anaerobacillus sp. CMMVII]MCT8137868.1 hypothetical protein [Anaerobacillus sp. CMMVII]